MSEDQVDSVCKSFASLKSIDNVKNCHLEKSLQSQNTFEEKNLIIKEPFSLENNSKKSNFEEQVQHEKVKKNNNRTEQKATTSICLNRRTPESCKRKYQSQKKCDHLNQCSTNVDIQSNNQPMRNEFQLKAGYNLRISNILSTFSPFPERSELLSSRHRTSKFNFSISSYSYNHFPKSDKKMHKFRSINNLSSGCDKQIKKVSNSANKLVSKTSIKQIFKKNISDVICVTDKEKVPVIDLQNKSQKKQRKKGKIVESKKEIKEEQKSPIQCASTKIGEKKQQPNHKNKAFTYQQLSKILSSRNIKAKNWRVLGQYSYKVWKKSKLL